MLRAVTIWFSLLAIALAQQTHPVSGRRLAPVMGVGGADWLERSEREMEEEPEKALDSLKIKPGSTVADIGAGVGYLTWRLAERVGPQGKVYANDIQQGMLDRLRENMATRHVTNVEAVLARRTIPGYRPRKSISPCWWMSIMSSPSRRRCSAIFAHR